MIHKIDHIGIAVRALSESVKYYEEVLGLTCESQAENHSQKVRVAFFRVGEVYLELLEPTSPDSPVAKFLAQNGEGIHHMAFATDNIAAQLKQASNVGVRLIHEVPFQGEAGKMAAFLHPSSTHGVLTEFCCETECGES